MLQNIIIQGEIDKLNTRNDFLETIKFDVASTIEEYSKYLYDYKHDFYSNDINKNRFIENDRRRVH